MMFQMSAGYQHHFVFSQNIRRLPIRNEEGGKGEEESPCLQCTIPIEWASVSSNQSVNGLKRANGWVPTTSIPFQNW